MDFNDLLVQHGFDPDKVMVMRHSPTVTELRKVLPWFAAGRPDLFNAYQQSQNPGAENALMKADFVASFLGDGDKAIFVGLYRRGDSHPINDKQFWAIPAVQELKKFGVRGIEGRETAQWFDLELLDFYPEWKGRLVIKWPPGRLWWRWAKRNTFAIHAIHEESLLVPKKPAWDKLSLTWAELNVLPTKWKAILGEWRGVYFILDVTDGKGYVGSAYGEDNLFGRWHAYAATGHGGDNKLKQRNPGNFVFTILQRTSPDMEPADVIRLESSWKDRLHTREFGLNDN